MQRFLDEQWAAGDPLRERVALDEFQYERRNAVAVLDAVDRRDVRMIQGREQARFTVEAGAALGIATEGLRQDLDRDLAAKPDVTGAVDLAHAAGPKGDAPASCTADERLNTAVALGETAHFDGPGRSRRRVV